MIRANIQEPFPHTGQQAHLFRIIRDADLEIEQAEADDLLETVETSLRQLRRGAVALLQVGTDMPARVLNILIENFEMTEDLVERTDARLGFGDWMRSRPLTGRSSRTRRSRRQPCGAPMRTRKSSSISCGIRTSWCTTRINRSSR